MPNATRMPAPWIVHTLDTVVATIQTLDDNYPDDIPGDYRIEHYRDDVDRAQNTAHLVVLRHDRHMWTPIYRTVVTPMCDLDRVSAELFDATVVGA